MKNKQVSARAKYSIKVPGCKIVYARTLKGAQKKFKRIMETAFAAHGVLRNRESGAAYELELHAGTGGFTKARKIA